MIKIEGQSLDYELDLNKSNENVYSITVDSRDDNGNVVPWAVIFASNKTIKYSEEGIDKLRITFDLSSIKNPEYILIENYKKESARVRIKPNLKESAEKKYVFRIYKYNILDDNKIKFMVKSEVNKEPIEWECTYNGKPFIYNINKNKNSITLELKSIPLSDIIAYIELTQNKSKKVINIEMEHHREGQMSIHRIF